jgi:hypothetical protein
MRNWNASGSTQENAPKIILLLMALKVLVLRFSSIGDIVLTTPVVRALKTQLPGVEVHYCTKKAF